MSQIRGVCCFSRKRLFMDLHRRPSVQRSFCLASSHSCIVQLFCTLRPEVFFLRERDTSREAAMRGKKIEERRERRGEEKEGGGEGVREKFSISLRKLLGPG